MRFQPLINLCNARVRAIFDFPGRNSFWLGPRCGLIFGHILLRIIQFANLGAIEDKAIPLQLSVKVSSPDFGSGIISLSDQ